MKKNFEIYGFMVSVDEFMVKFIYRFMVLVGGFRLRVYGFGLWFSLNGLWFWLMGLYIVNFFQSSEDCRRIKKNSAAFLLAMYTLKIKSVA